MVVKKYSNRRLYDTDESRYITLEELAERVREGHDPYVLDAKTGEDLTQATLAQIILESRGAAKLLPTPLLTRLVRMGDDALAEFFGQFMSFALELYLQAKSGLGPYNPFAIMSPFARAFSGLSGIGEGAFRSGSPVTGPGPGDRSPAEARSSDEEVRALRRELEALKRDIGATNATKKKR